MKLILLACPHGDPSFLKIPLQEIDAVLIAGDLGKADKARALRMKYPDASDLSEKASKEELQEMIEENVSSAESILKHFSQKPTYWISGNADESDGGVEEKNITHGLKIKPLGKRVTSKNVLNIDLKKIKIGDLTIAGVPYFVATNWLKEFLGTETHRSPEEKDAEEKAKEFVFELEKVDVLLCHNPPYGHLDFVDNPIVPKNWNKKHAGSKIVLDYIIKRQPKYAVFGHIHEAKGESKIGNTELINTACSWKVLEI